MSDPRPVPTPVSRSRIVMMAVMHLGCTERHLADRLSVPQSTWRHWMATGKFPDNVIDGCEVLLRKKIKAAEMALAEIEKFKSREPA